MTTEYEHSHDGDAQEPNVYDVDPPEIAHAAAELAFARVQEMITTLEPAIGRERANHLSDAVTHLDCVIREEAVSHMAFAARTVMGGFGEGFILPPPERGHEDAP